MPNKKINLNNLANLSNLELISNLRAKNIKEGPKEDASFTKQLDKYISEQAKQAESKNTDKKENFTAAKKLDEYITQQAREYESNKLSSKPIQIVSPEVEAKATSPEIAELMNKYPSFNLGLGSEGGAVKDLQKTLNGWLPKLRLNLSGRYDWRTAKAVTLFKAVYNTGKDGRKVDLQTAKFLTGIKDGSFWKFDTEKADQYHPEKTISGEILHKAASYLGTPYRLGGDGNYTTDCAMLTKNALIKAEAVNANFVSDQSTRMADMQYLLAEQRKGNLQLVSNPKPGDIIFFKNTSYQAGIAYKRITHVGIYVGKNVMLAASPSYGGVTLQNISDINPKLIAGFARAVLNPTSFASRQVETGEIKT